MKPHRSKATRTAPRLPKCPTGIQGLDEITGGGLRQADASPQSKPRLGRRN